MEGVERKERRGEGRWYEEGAKRECRTVGWKEEDGGV